MPDPQLTAALRQAKSSKMFFAFIPKGATDGKLIVSKQKIPPKAIAEAKQKIGGGSPVTGRCSGPLDSMVFQVTRAASDSIANGIKRVAHRDSGISIVPALEVGAEADADECAGDAGAEAATPARPKTAGPDPKVTDLQKTLKSLGFDPGNIDGVMGPRTQDAITKFQKANGLKTDGIAGPDTQAAMTKALQGGGSTNSKPAQNGEVQKAASSAASAAGPADAKPPLPVPQINVKPGEEKGTLLSLAQSLDSIKPVKGDFSDGAHYTIVMNGKPVQINQKEVDTNRKNAQAAFANAIRAVQVRTSNASNTYKIYRETITTGTFGKVVTFVYDHTSVTDPGTQVTALCGTANAEAQKALSAANGNQYVTAANALIAADTAAHKALALIMAYKDGIESSAESTVTVLEGVKTASEITLAVGGAVVSGGATVAFAGAVGMTAAEDLGPALSGDKVDWGKFAFDMALAVVIKKLGPAEKLEEAVLAKMGTAAVKKVGVKAVQEAFAKVVGATGETLLKKSLDTARKALSGKDVSWDKFVEETKKDLIKEYTVAVLKVILKK